MTLDNAISEFKRSRDRSSLIGAALRAFIEEREAYSRLSMYHTEYLRGKEERRYTRASEMLSSAIGECSYTFSVSKRVVECSIIQLAKDMEVLSCV